MQEVKFKEKKKISKNALGHLLFNRGNKAHRRSTLGIPFLHTEGAPTSWYKLDFN